MCIAKSTKRGLKRYKEGKRGERGQESKVYCVNSNFYCVNSHSQNIYTRLRTTRFVFTMAVSPFGIRATKAQGPDHSPSIKYDDKIGRHRF